MSDSKLLAQGDNRTVASGNGRCEEEQKGSLDKRFLCIWAQVELDNSHSDRQWYLGQDTALYLLLASISLFLHSLSQASGSCQVSLTKNIRVSQLGIWRLQFY